jgi:hypothetical protein
MSFMIWCISTSAHTLTSKQRVLQSGLKNILTARKKYPHIQELGIND